MAGKEVFETSTDRLTADCSTTELLPIMGEFYCKTETLVSKINTAIQLLTEKKNVGEKKNTSRNA